MKNFFIQICKNLLKIFFIFPIKKNRIVFSSYSGKNYSCNPKYITEYLLKNNEKNYQIIWAFINPDNQVIDSCITKVKFKSLLYIYYALTAKVFVDNVESWSILPKRKGQMVLNTWHGGGAYKGVGLNRKDTSSAVDRNMLEKHKRVDVYLSSSKYFSKHTLRQSFGYEGEILEVGMPRNDILQAHNDFELIKTIKESIGIHYETKIVLFAPTFRNNTNFHYSLDYVSVIDALKSRFGGEWVLLQRAHYYLQSEAFAQDIAIDVSDYPDMQELLLISDVLITDYSSSIWDFSLMGRPAFLYTPDLKEYELERAFYTPIDEWPYPYAEDMTSFKELIINFDYRENEQKIKKHLIGLENTETGIASEFVAKKIREVCGI